MLDKTDSCFPVSNRKGITACTICEAPYKTQKLEINRQHKLWKLIQLPWPFQRKLEDDLEKRGKEVMKLEGKVKAMSEELKKGNEIIKKLQAEIKNYHSKVHQQFFLFLRLSPFMAFVVHATAFFFF